MAELPGNASGLLARVVVVVGLGRWLRAASRAHVATARSTGPLLAAPRPHIGTMLKLMPIVLAVAYGLVMYLFSAWRTKGILDARSRPLDDAALLAMTGRLAVAQGVQTLPVHVFEVPGVNGMAAPDGRIFLTRGFIDRYRAGAVSAEELAGVIAHELGHVAMGHARRRMIDMTGQNAVFVVLTPLLSRFVPFFGVWIARFIATALAAGLSRKAEHEADAYASALLVKAGIGTGPQKSLFRKLDALVGGTGGAPDWLRSHPRTEERIRLIEAREAKWGLA